MESKIPKTLGKGVSFPELWNICKLKKHCQKNFDYECVETSDFFETNWLEGRVKEIARVYHEMFGVNNITYNMTHGKVEFYTDGYFLAIHKDMWRSD